jgi:hypothetical protein
MTWKSRRSYGDRWIEAHAAQTARSCNLSSQLEQRRSPSEVRSVNAPRRACSTRGLAASSAPRWFTRTDTVRRGEAARQQCSSADGMSPDEATRALHRQSSLDMRPYPRRHYDHHAHEP